MMAKKKPTRARTHELEDESYTRFRAARPSAWPLHKIDGSDDYGRDLLVEIFEAGQPTGNEFSVQLKAKERLVGAAKVRLKATTLNHWEDQPSPTLIVLWDAASDQLFYEWAHRLPWSDPQSDKKTRTVTVPHPWTEETPALLAREADAFRKVRRLGQHYPVDVQVAGNEFFGEDAGPVVAAVIDAFTPLREFSITFGTPRVPFVSISILPNGVEVSMSGTPVKKMTYGPAAQPPPEVIAGDVLFALSFAVGVLGGSPEVGTSLMKAAVDDSFMAVVAGRLVDAVVILARSDSREALTTLLGRTLFVEDHPNSNEALLGLETVRGDMSEDLRRALASSLEAAASGWKRPAKMYRTAAWMLAALDGAKSVELWDAAVDADPDTLKQPGYWAQRGGVFFLDDRWEEAVLSYKEAVRLGDETSRPLLADALMWAGEYADSLREFRRSRIGDGDEDAEWRLKLGALPNIVDGLGIWRQNRDPFLAENMWFENQMHSPTPEFIEDVLAKDALFGWASWAMAPLLREHGSEPLFSLLLASVSMLAVPEVLQELAVAAIRCGAWGIARDAFLTAQRTCGPEFIRMVHTDQVIDRQMRELLLELWGNLADRDKFFAILDRLPRDEDSD